MLLKILLMLFSAMVCACICAVTVVADVYLYFWTGARPHDFAAIFGISALGIFAALIWSCAFFLAVGSLLDR